MKLPKPVAHSVAVVAAVVVSLALSASSFAQTVPGKAEVRALKGTATYSVAGAPAVPLKKGTVLEPGAVIRTASGSMVDLYLGNTAGVVRVTENTTLELTKLTMTDTGADTVVEVQLSLPDGTILGEVNKLTAASKYEIKVPNGVAGIRGTKYRISSASYLVVREGTVVFVYVPPGGQPTPYTLVAPPPVYFSPLEGVKPAPADLIAEFDQQLGRPFTPPGPPPAVPFREPFVSPGIGGRPSGVNPGGNTPGGGNP